MHDRAFYAVTMAMCAITSARMRDGASYLLDAGVKAHLPADAPTSEAFYEAAARTFPADLSQASEFDYKRAKVIIAMLCIQFGNVRQLTTHLGDYMTLCSIDNFHLEARWPPNLPETEVQERRRLVSPLLDAGNESGAFADATVLGRIYSRRLRSHDLRGRGAAPRGAEHSALPGAGA